MKRVKIVILLFVLGGIGVLFLLLTRQMTLPFLYNSKGGQMWTLGYVEVENPLAICFDSISWIDNGSFNKFPHPGIMADPFITVKEDTIYIFYEEKSGKRNSNHGNICVLKSIDGQTWDYMGYAMDAAFHLSWPNVFKSDSNFFMIPEKGMTRELAIYKSTDFPLKWQKYSVIFSDVSYTDPAVFYQDSLWFLFVEMNKKLRLFYNRDFTSTNWVEHPMSPISFEDESRLGGGVQEIDGQPYLFIQVSENAYGTGVYAYTIDTMTTECYTMKKNMNPVLWRYGESYAKDGMHTLNFIKRHNGKYLCVVDGTKIVNSTSWKWSWRNLPEFHWRWNQID